MANTYSQIYIQIVFTVKDRSVLIPKEKKDELYKYITGIVKKRGQKLLAINGMSDHIHVFVGMKPDLAISDLVRDIKAGSSGFIYKKRMVKRKFSWQEGFGAFSYSRSDIDAVIHYIQNQEYHHRTITFHDEYIKMLKEFAVEYDDRYLFEWIEKDQAGNK
ncbi:MAG: IS200/IS605 family transposase [Bacteroidota bacterium]